MRRMIWIGLLLALAMTGCVSRYERDMAMAQAAAAQAQAQERIAYHDSQAAIVREQETTERANAWSATLPWLAAVVILGGGVVGAGWLVLWYRGRAHLVAVQAQAGAMMLPPPWQWPALPPPTQRPALPARDEAPAAVARAAERVGGLYRPDPDTPGAWLIEAMDGSRRIRMLPAPRE